MSKQMYAKITKLDRAIRKKAKKERLKVTDVADRAHDMAMAGLTLNEILEKLK